MYFPTHFVLLTIFFLYPSSFLIPVKSSFHLSSEAQSTSLLVDSARDGSTSPNPGDSRRDVAKPDPRTVFSIL
jgi:hypothetical protein